MGLAETANLLVKITMQDSASATAGHVKTSIRDMGVAVLGAAGAAGFGALAAGALQAQAAQGQFMAATGASRAEAEQFVSSMDGLAGSAGTVGMKFSDLAALGTMVEQQFGTTGQKTQDLTENIAEFARVTGTDATGAAGDLEDTLSAYGLSADDARGFMDELVASNQKFGTDVGPAALDVLRNISPALQDMGADLDDGVGFLNLFETAGLDAGTAAAGLNKAVKELKPGQTLDDLIAQLGAIEDPTLRAQAAIEIFGSKAGPKLAAAIQPGMTSLDDFKVSAEGAQGAVTDAANNMLTDADKIKGVAEKIVAGAREIGQEFGPALMGLSSLGSLLAPMAGKFTDLIKDIAARILPQAVIAGTERGVAEGVAEAEGATGSGMIASFLAKFGLMTPAKVVASAAAGALEGEAEGTASAEAATSPSILAKFKAGGGGLGTALGVGVGVAAAVAIDQWGQQEAAQLSELRSKLDAALGDDPAGAKKVQEAIEPWRGLVDITGQALQTLPILGTATGQIGTDMRGLAADVDTAAQSVGGLQEDFRESLRAIGLQAITIGTETGTNLATGTKEGYGQGIAALDKIASQAIVGASEAAAVAGSEAFGQRWIAMGQAQAKEWAAPFLALGHAVPSAIAEGIIDNGKEVMGAGDRLIQLLKEGLSPAEEAAKLMGEKYTKAVAQGIVSEIPGAKQAAQQMAIQAIKMIEDAAGGTPNTMGLKAIGSYYDSLLASGLDAKSTAVALAAAGVSAAAIQRLTGYYPDYTSTGVAYSAHIATGITSATSTVTSAASHVNTSVSNLPWGTWGRNIGTEYGQGIAAGINGVNFTGKIDHLLDLLRGLSPPKEGPLKDIDKWGESVGAAYVDGMAKGLNGAAVLFERVPSVASPPLIAAQPSKLPDATNFTDAYGRQWSKSDEVPSLRGPVIGVTPLPPTSVVSVPRAPIVNPPLPPIQIDASLTISAREVGMQMSHYQIIAGRPPVSRI